MMAHRPGQRSKLKLPRPACGGSSLFRLHAGRGSLVYERQFGTIASATNHITEAE